MEKKIARINWSRGQYSDVYRSTIVNPSPLKQGQKIQVLWCKTKKEYTAVVACFLMEELPDIPTISQDELPPRQARVKRKLVSVYSIRNPHDLHLPVTVTNVPASLSFHIHKQIGKYYSAIGAIN